MLLKVLSALLNINIPHLTNQKTVFLNDLVKMFKQKRWKVIDAEKAFKDSIFTKSPSIAPAGESIIWALAKESGKFNELLRYPAEDEGYERKRMDELGL